MPELATEIAAKNLALEASLLEIVDAFQTSSVQFMVIKGIPLARRLYGRIDRRAILDNDLLVSSGQAAMAADALARLGYRPYRHRVLNADRKYQFEFPMDKRRRGTVISIVDLHWRMFHPALYRIDEETVWEGAEQYELKGRRFTVPGKTMTVLHLAAHFAQHEFRAERILVDLASAWNLWAQEINREQLLSLARTCGLVPALHLAFEAAASLNLLKVPAPGTESRRAVLVEHLLPVNSMFDGTDPKSYRRRFLPLLLVGPVRAGKYVLNEVFPPPEIMAAIYGRPAGMPLYFRYLERPLRPLLAPAVRRLLRRQAKPDWPGQSG